MKKTMSLKQVAANRRNAQKSTGPRTAAGRAVSKVNALKHGILSTQMLVRGQASRLSPSSTIFLPTMKVAVASSVS